MRRRGCPVPLEVRKLIVFASGVVILGHRIVEKVFLDTKEPLTTMRILMMGTGPFAVPTFRSLLNSNHEVLALVTRPVSPARGRRKSSPNPMREVADDVGLMVLDPPDVNASETVADLAAFAADLLVVCDYGQILSADALRTTRFGGINLHASLLPEYRGAAPINWALLDGRTETGVTVIHMTPKLDGGPCLVQLATPIDPWEDAVRLEQRLAVLGVEAVARSIELLSKWDGQSTLGKLQDPKRVTRAPRLKKSDGQVHWERSATQIFHQVRALKPWPGTFTDLNRANGKRQRLILDKVSIADAPDEESRPGEVMQVDKSTLWVGTGDGVLSLDRVKPAGKRTMDISEFLRGHLVAPGDTFV